jgi:hypothetical protein
MNGPLARPRISNDPCVINQAGTERGAELVHPGRADGRRAMKWKDEPVEEVRTTREAYAAQFDYDLDRMFEDLKKKEEQNLATLANLKPLKPHEQRA